ncbi:MAG: response regulator [Deltaproteobacteria bacterium]|nr:response regulator [Deltaproteobacteria bacterium]
MEEKIKILLVDDEIDFLEASRKRLAKRGYLVECAASCGAALPVLERNWPDVVVLDVMLPDKNGIQFLKEIKGQWPRLAVILLSGHASMQAGVQGIEHGAYDYCLKPVELDELIEKIKLACEEAR